MLYALTSAYSRRDYDNEQQGLPMQTNIGKLFSILAWGFGEVEEQAELIRLWDDLNQAKGAVLDRYGANWGVRRFNENDALYRLAIIVKVMSQLSGGDTDTVIKAAAELLGVEYTDITFEDVFPAKIALYVDWLLLTEERQELIEPIAWFIKRILAAGVGMRLYIRTYRTFRYDLPISHGGAIMTSFRYEPTGQDREDILSLDVARGGAIESRFSSLPVGKDRSLLRPVPVAHGGAVISDFTYPPTGEDRSLSAPLTVGHSGVLRPSISGDTPDPQRAAKVRQDGAGGAYTRTHIKPRRID